MNHGNDSINRNAVVSSSASMTTFLFKLNGSLDTVIEDGVYPFALFSLRCGINRDPSTSDSKFDAPNALDRALLSDISHAAHSFPISQLAPEVAQWFVHLDLRIPAYRQQEVKIAAVVLDSATRLGTRWSQIGRAYRCHHGEN